MIGHFEMRTSNVNSKILDLTDLVSVPVLDLDDLGFFKETLIFKTWNFKLLIRKKEMPLQGELSNVLIF